MKYLIHKLWIQSKDCGKNMLLKFYLACTLLVKAMRNNYKKLK